MLKTSIISVGLLLLTLTACSSASPASTPTQIPTSVPPTATAEMPAAVPPPTDELRQLRANPWQWVSLTTAQETIKIDDPARYRVTFNIDASLAVTADCNNASGSYQGEGGKLTVEIETKTKAACPPGSRSDQFISLLGSGVHYSFADGQLLIDLALGGGTLALAPADDALVPTEPATTTSAIKAVPFDLGPSVITQTWMSNEKFRNLPIELNGLIAVPPTGQNLPIAVIMHGSHEIGCPSPDGYTSEWPCPGKEIPNYQGFAYLLEALAARGYVAISINANPAFVSAYGMPAANDRLPLLLDQYLAKIAAANNGEDAGLGVDLKGRLDWKQLVVLGHSAGGEAVNWVIDSRADRTTPDHINAGQGPIAAAVLLAPSATQDTAQLKDGAAVAVILPACDRDVSDLSGQKYYEAARRQAQRDEMAVAVYLPGMNHNRFNTELGDETLSNVNSICDNALVPADAQRQFLATYVPDFFDTALGRSVDAAPVAGLDPAHPARPPCLIERYSLRWRCRPVGVSRCRCRRRKPPPQYLRCGVKQATEQQVNDQKYAAVSNITSPVLLKNWCWRGMERMLHLRLDYHRRIVI